MDHIVGRVTVITGFFKCHYAMAFVEVQVIFLLVRKKKLKNDKTLLRVFIYYVALGSAKNWKMRKEDNFLTIEQIDIFVNYLYDLKPIIWKFFFHRFEMPTRPKNIYLKEKYKNSVQIYRFDN